MATQMNFNKKDDEKDQNPTMGGAPAPSQAAPVSALNTPQNKGTSSGRFTNINSYLQANRNNQLGQNISGRIGGVGQQVTNTLDKERNQFQQKTAQAFKPFENAQQFTQQAIQDPTAFIQDNPNTPEDESAANLQRFQQIRQGQYGGPQQLNNVDAMRAGAANVQNLAGLTGTEAGRQALLRNFYSKPQYSTGQRSLDNLLLQVDPRQLGQLTSSRAIAANLNRQVDTGIGQAANEFSQKKLLAQSMGKDTTERLQKEQAARDKELADRVLATQGKESEIQQEIERLRSGLSGGMLSRADAEKLGVDTSLPEQNLYEANMLDPFKTDIYGGPIDAQAVASEEQARRVNALQKLAGEQAKFDLDKVNKYKQSSYSFDKDKFAQELEKGKQKAAALEKQRAENYAFMSGLTNMNTNPQAFLDNSRPFYGNGLSLNQITKPVGYIQGGSSVNSDASTAGIAAAQASDRYDEMMRNLNKAGADADQRYQSAAANLANLLSRKFRIIG